MGKSDLAAVGKAAIVRGSTLGRLLSLVEESLVEESLVEESWTR